jgi:hypothetical protein
MGGKSIEKSQASKPAAPKLSMVGEITATTLDSKTNRPDRAKLIEVAERSGSAIAVMGWLRETVRQSE